MTATTHAGPMWLTLTDAGPVLERGGERWLLDDGWDELFRRADLKAHLSTCTGGALGHVDPTGDDAKADPADAPRAPVGRQEVWAAGITYYASRDARMEEAATENNADVYQRCYDAERPELFMKSTPHRVVGPGGVVRIRADSAWNVPEPELTIVMTAHAEVLGYTIGNDMSSRDIEGENPLYLPQAKTYDGCVALGPSILVTQQPPPPDCEISLLIERREELSSTGFVEAFRGSTTVARIRRSFDVLIDHLWRHCSFPDGCFLLTGTGIVPPSQFTLEPGDRVSISIDGIGTLTNVVDVAEAGVRNESHLRP